MSGSETVLPVPGASPYDVVIGHDLGDRLPGILGEDVRRVALLYADDLAEQAQPVLDTLVAHYDVLALGLPAGEQAKSTSVANDCWEALGEAGFTRSDAVVTFGGGATTDLGGFVAATWLRGVRVVHVPTTLLAMVDAAVGGKTGVNTGAGKNLVGSFHEPAGVLCDLATLASLPTPELRAGLGEVVKCGFIADPAILDMVESDPRAALDPTSPVLRELVERSVRVKIDVVVGDLRETGGAGGHPGREVLNYGHTMAHAIERASEYDVRHGEAVAIGCVYVAELARAAGLLADDVADRHRTAFAAVGLPTTWAGARFEELLAAMRVDKKTRGDQLRFVVLDALASPRVLAGPDEAHLQTAYDVMSGAAS
ncbi:3-dehydroquinate synthase [Nocardioides donggukensis]|uniref:3-dehydroquinate synthase n=1 Tax=Nocardioides donggukensis TaxID=2774019 RepID=A0A927K453_9ACTN|nr:3-dehydroquinate synthase [Nocardioides donggukensis]MBD8869752.1 3-dehydroquinate synthase [Nocardioides donggukensis]